MSSVGSPGTAMMSASLPASIVPSWSLISSNSADVTVADWYPIVDRTDLPGYYVCIGTSGSSFKTAPVLGSLVATLITENESGRDTDLDPLEFSLPRIDRTIGIDFLSRRRGKLASSGTVIG